MLKPDLFKAVISATPLISIDLVVYDDVGRVLLGSRKNRPAKGYWFVPGGRILKNETLDGAFSRITYKELGIQISRNKSNFLGVYEHMYSDCVFGHGEGMPSTHYVVLAHTLSSEFFCDIDLPSDQHEKFQWWKIDEALQSDLVHENTKVYLKRN